MGKEKNYHLNHNCVAKGKCTSMKTRLADGASEITAGLKLLASAVIEAAISVYLISNFSLFWITKWLNHPPC